MIKELDTEKILKKYGNTYVLTLSPDEIKILEVKEDSILKVKLGVKE